MQVTWGTCSDAGSHSEGLGWGLRLCISNRPVMLLAHRQDTALSSKLSRTRTIFYIYIRSTNDNSRLHFQGLGDSFSHFNDQKTLPLNTLVTLSKNGRWTLAICPFSCGRSTMDAAICVLLQLPFPRQPRLLFLLAPEGFAGLEQDFSS